ncbi:EF-hand domain-containing protein [Paracraurococcus ruber]|nr:EF-hand domain-containing protein [Paracraurococcus ruber]
MRPTIVLAFALLTLAAEARAQPDSRSWAPWGGADSPGGLFGGDPAEVAPRGDAGVTHDQVWQWLRGRFDQADRDRSGSLTPDEIRAHPQARATFRAADADRNGRVTLEELRPLSEQWFRAHDANGDNQLTRREMPARQRAAKPAG